MQSVKEETKVRMDDLILQNCASKLSFLERSLLEAVSRQFLMSLSSTYSTTRISLHIGSKKDGVEVNEFIFLDGRCKKKNQEKYSCVQVHRNQLRNGLAFLFARYQRFCRLKIETLWFKMSFVIRDILRLSSKEEYFPMEMDELILTNYYDAGPNSALIHRFSTLIKKLPVLGLMPETEWEAKRIWKAINHCSNLEALSYYPEGEKYLDDYGEDEPTPPIDLLKCLRNLKLKSFHSCATFYTDKWLSKAFAFNDQLRVLLVENAERQLFEEPSALQLISRLQAFGMYWTKDSFILTKEEISEVEMTLESLPDDGYVEIVCNTHRISFEIEFWMKIADRTGKSVRLYLERNHPLRLLPLEFYAEEAIESISFIDDWDDGVQYKQYGPNKIVLKLGKVSLVLKVIEVNRMTLHS